MLFGSRKGCVIFYLYADSNIAVERIKKRGKHVHAHENVNDLYRLKEEFDKTVVLATKRGLDIVKINAGYKSAEDVVNEMEIIVKQKLEHSSLQIS
jgi:thymidylate kinase